MDNQLNSLIPGLAPDLIFGVVAPVGAELTPLQANLEQILADYGFAVNTIRLSGFLKDIEGLTTPLVLDGSEVERIKSHMDAGNELRTRTRRNDVLALYAIAAIHKWRTRNPGAPRTLHFI